MYDRYKCTRELAPGDATWGEAVNLALTCSGHFGTEGLEEISGSLTLLVFRPLKAGTAMNFLAGPGKALVLEKTKQLSNMLVNAPHCQTLSPLQLHRGQHSPFTPFCHQKPQGCTCKLTCLVVTSQLHPYHTGLRQRQAQGSLPPCLR